MKATSGTWQIYCGYSLSVYRFGGAKSKGKFSFIQDGSWCGPSIFTGEGERPGMEGAHPRSDYFSGVLEGPSVSWCC